MKGTLIFFALDNEEGLCARHMILLMGSVSLVEKVEKGIVVGFENIQCKMMIL
jgi:hypothetical protein